MTVRLRCKTLLNPGGRFMYNLAPWKRLHKKQVLPLLMLYKAAAIAVKFRTILK
ncbi:hypothetical protein ACP26F_19270 [Franconibacter pulveris 1160]|jgi:hypothetical protein|uniref:Transposase n=1 Tax=Franconibacter daqui TaxID=2047724 RepID=A0ABV1PK82_9ENTR|nr:MULTISPECIES: hypothetical protein [Franconibacter]MCK1968941.1 hypothetical protein [Franconibacter sp. IITDAS19]MEB5922026.1 hypothetical protein [Franconibacter daqui]